MPTVISPGYSEDSPEPKDLVSVCKALVAKSPEDRRLKVLLAAAHILEEEYKEPIPELQQALNYPELRYIVMTLLAHCYRKRHLDDLSDKQIETLLDEL